MQNALLEVKNLSININEHRTISVDFSLERGESVRILGKSGTGKTTVLRSLARLNPVSGGDILFGGIGFKQISSSEWRRKIIYVSQFPVMFPGSVLFNLQLPFSFRKSFKSQFNIERAEELISKTGLTGEILDQDTGIISGGEAARIALIRALICDPDILMTDELTAPLDEESSEQTISVIKDWMQDGTKGLIVVAHRAELWDEIIDKNVEIKGTLNSNRKI